MQMPQIISIEGNIGAGKTTLIQTIEALQLPNVMVLREPVDEWLMIQDSTGKNILEHYYSDPKKYAFTFQTIAFNTRLSNIKKAMTAGCHTIICERSLQSDTHIFAKMLFEDKTMDEISYCAYQSLYKDCINDYPLNKVIYLDVSPEICKERILKRGRSGEESIHLDYLQLCDKYHREWLENTELEYPVIKYTNIPDLIALITN